MSNARSRATVTLVRPQGGQKRTEVTVTRERGQIGEGFNIEEVQRRLEEKKSISNDYNAIADIRGKKAFDRIAEENWLRSQIQQSEVDLKKAIRLTENLRATNIVQSAARKVDIIDVVANDDLSEDNSDKENSDKTEIDDHRRKISKSNDRETNKISDTFKSDLRKSKINNALSDKRISRNLEDKETLSKLTELLMHLGPLDNTEASSGLSTILENGESSFESSRATPDGIDHVDLVPVRGPTPEDDVRQSSSISPFTALNQIVRDKPEAPTSAAANYDHPQSDSIDSVSQLILRMRSQREALENKNYLIAKGSQEKNIDSTLFSPLKPQTLEDTFQGGHLNSSKPFQLDQQFIRKVLDFSKESSLSPIRTNVKVKVNVLTSSTSSSSNPSITELRKRKKKRKPPKTAATSKDDIDTKKDVQEAIPSKSDCDKDKKLKYYIEKLLDMKHEDIANLSDITQQATLQHHPSTMNRHPEVSEILPPSRLVTPSVEERSSSLRSSSSSTSRKQVRFRDSDLHEERLPSDTMDTEYRDLRQGSSRNLNFRSFQQPEVRDLQRSLFRADESDSVYQSLPSSARDIGDDNIETQRLHVKSNSREISDIQELYNAQRQRIQEKIRSVAKDFSGSSSLASGPLSSLSSSNSTPLDSIQSMTMQERIVRRNSAIGDESVEVQRVRVTTKADFSETETFNFSQSQSCNSSGSQTISYIDLSDDSWRIK